MIEKSPKSRQSFYTLPGGTREANESLQGSVVREVYEETGAAIDVLDLLWTEQRKVPSKRSPSGIMRKIEYIFRCSVDSGYKAKLGPSPDSAQTGVRWLPLDRLFDYPIATKRLRETLATLLAETG